jgi:hypothetical protein
MHATTFLHKLLSPVMHLKRLETLKLMVVAALKERRVSVTGLGRALEGEALEKSNILRSSRFISNAKLYNERWDILQRLVNMVIGTKIRPWILVDWTKIPNTNEYGLRAALVAKGRAIVLYEEVHPKKLEGNRIVHRTFLRRLQQLLGASCSPIMVTDAGFHNPWFSDVKSLGWDYVGRIRGKKRYQKSGEADWPYCRDLFPKATSEGRFVGEVKLCKSGSMATRLYLIKEDKKERISKPVYAKNKGKKKGGRTGKEQRASAHEPWLLATSLEGGYSIKKKVFKIYFSRMQIEEGIRDLKSSQYGFSFEKARSTTSERIEILLLIAQLASFIAWVTGWIGEKNKWHYKFQANSIKNRRVLSLFTLGCRIIKKDSKKMKIPINIFLNAIKESMESINMELIQYAA